jgi:hypothetical protein
MMRKSAPIDLHIIGTRQLSRGPETKARIYEKIMGRVILTMLGVDLVDRAYEVTKQGLSTSTRPLTGSAGTLRRPRSGFDVSRRGSA